MKLYRSTRDRKIFGLCGGLAEVFGIDPTILRVIVLLGTFFSAGAVFLLYIMAALVIPKEQTPYSPPPYYGNGSPGSWGYSHQTGFGTTGQAGPAQGTFQGQTARQPERADSKLDDMMKDIERKALLKEIDELKARLAKLEQDKNAKGDE